MTTNFQHDVFLSHSSKDKAVVWSLAERLRADGPEVWSDQRGATVGTGKGSRKKGMNL